MEEKKVKHQGISRRDFIKGTAAGALGIAATGLLGACTTENKTPQNEGPIDNGLMSYEKANQKWGFEIAPAPIAESDIKETIEVDVVVVGAGAAGLVTANSAAEENLSVVVVCAGEKPSARGGSNNAVYCKAMEKAGVPRVTPWMYHKEIFAASNKIDQAKWYKHYNNSEHCANWAIDLMEEAGYEVTVEYGTPMEEGSLFTQATAAIGWELGKDMEPDPNLTLMTGMMQPVFVKRLAERLTDELKQQIHFKTTGRQLIREKDNTGRVTALIAQKEDGSYVKYVGKKAVVLATGDFSADREMMTKYAPDSAHLISDTVYNAAARYDIGFEYGGLMKGDGQKMGLWVGAAWQNTFPNCPMTFPELPGPASLYGTHWGLMMNRDGKRFMNEYCMKPIAGMTALTQPGKVIYALWDKGYASNVRTTGSWNNDSAYSGTFSQISQEEADITIAAWEKSVEDGLYVKGDTMEEVIEKLGLPNTAVETVQNYNEMAKNKKDTEFYKSDDFMFEIKEGPFYGQKLPLKLGFLTILGGLRTNVDMQVCDAEDNAIAGLYNVGAMVGDMYAGTYTFQVEGACYGMNCLTFGYMAGKYIAEHE